jgi:hypothetical protein
VSDLSTRESSADGSAEINFVTDNSILQSRISFYNKRNRNYSFIFSDSPDLNHPGIGLYILPVSVFFSTLPESGIPCDVFPAPVICYGHEYHMKNAVISGCSDYLRDPWSLDELTFRIGMHLCEHILRYDWGILSFFPFGVKFQSRTAALSPAEYSVLRFAARHRGRIIPRRVLLSLINPGLPENSRVADTHICRIRKKITDLAPEIIGGESVFLTVRNAGYLLK